MVKRVLISMLFLAFIGFASATISISEPNDFYNVGDFLYVSASGLLGADSGNFNMDLVCGNQTINIVRVSARLFDKEVEQTYPPADAYKILNAEDLGINNISNILGSCQITVTMGSMAATTKTFTITNKITLTSSLDKSSYNPEENIQLTVTATKMNGKPLNGFIKATNSTEFEVEIKDGSLTHTFSMPSTTEAGTYTLGLKAYDTNSVGSVLNEGTSAISFTINQVPTSITPSLSELEVMPGEDLTVGAEVLDQSGKSMDGTVTAKIVSPDSESSEKIFDAGDFVTFEFPSNATAGTWRLISTFGDLTEESEFTLAEVKKADFKIVDGVLTITNLGNVDYDRIVNVRIGEEEMNLELNIGIGESRKFALKAADGEYQVIVTDGEKTLDQTVLLTGKAVSVKDLESVGIFKNYSIIWIFLIILVGAIVLILVIRHKKKKTIYTNSGEGIGSKIKKVGGVFKSKVEKKVPAHIRGGISESLTFTKKSPAASGLDSDSYHHEDTSLMDLTKKGASGAESALVMKGEKYPSAIVSISIGNYEKLSDNSRLELKKIIDSARESKGLVDWRNDYVFIIFSPLITKTYHNESLAVKAGSKILQKIAEHNRKFKSKIEFNIGVNSGQMVSSKEGGKLKYTGLGNTISLAKRISDSDSGKLLISEEVRKKMIRDLKVTKAKTIGNYQTYLVSGIKNKEANEAKLKDLLKRMDK